MTFLIQPIAECERTSSPHFEFEKFRNLMKHVNIQSLLKIVNVYYFVLMSVSWIFKLIWSHNSYNKEVAIYPGTNNITILRNDIEQPVDTFRRETSVCRVLHLVGDNMNIVNE